MRIPQRAIFVGVVASVALGAGALSIARASAVTSYPTSLTEAAPSALIYGQTATVSGRLTLLGAPFGLSGERVALSRRAKGAKVWTIVGTHTTNGQGDVAFSVAPTVGSEFEPTHATDAYTTSSSSAVRTINIRHRVTAVFGKTTVARKTPDTISTVVSPNAHATSVLLQAYTAGSWKTIGTRNLNASSAVTFTFTAPAAAGHYYYRIFKPGDQAYLPGVSPVATLNVT